jgi:hypothetical protein
VHPHCLTGAKGFETSFRNYDLNALKDDAEDLLAKIQYEDLLQRDSNQLSRSSRLSSSTKDICKLALDTEEDEAVKEVQPQILTSTNEVGYNRNSRIVLNSDLFSRSLKQKNILLTQNVENTNFMNSHAKIEASQNELDLVLMQSPEDVKFKNVDLDKLDTEILITGEDNEYIDH